MRQIAILVLAATLGACSSQSPGMAQSPSETALSDRELAWCLDTPGAVGAVATDAGSGVPDAAQAIADDGIYDNAGRWAFYEAWDESTYARHCATAYVQFDGADDEVDLAILDPAARSPTPVPTGNMATSDLRARAAELLPQMERAGEDLVDAIRSGDDAAMAAAATVMRDITGPEYDALSGAVAEPCYTDAGAAYGMTLFNWDAVANNVNRYLTERDDLLLELALDFASDAEETAAEWRQLEAAACR